MKAMVFTALLALLLTDGGAQTKPSTAQEEFPIQDEVLASDWFDPKRPTILRNYDRFKNETSLHLRLPRLMGNAGNWSREIHFSYFCTGEIIRCRPKYVFWTMIIPTSEWTYHDYGRDLDLLVDGKRLHLGKGAWDGSVIEARYLKEYLVFAVPSEKFLRISHASTVEGQVAGQGFYLKPEFQRALRAFASNISKSSKARRR